MSSSLKKSVKKGQKMQMTLAKKHQAQRQNSIHYSKALAFFPLSEKKEEICHNIDKNLFKLEKDLAYFSFVICEIKEAT